MVRWYGPGRRRRSGPAATAGTGPRCGAGSAARLRRFPRQCAIPGRQVDGSHQGRKRLSPRRRRPEVQLSTDGKEGNAYGMLSWSPDSANLVAFRIEPGERKEVLPGRVLPKGGGRAKMQSRPYPLPAISSRHTRLNLLRSPTASRPNPTWIESIRYAARPLEERRPALHVPEGRPRPPNGSD